MKRVEVPLAIDFLYANDARSFWLVTLGRWACIPFSLIGGYTCFWWARRLYGLPAGRTALILWCFAPYILGHASLVTPDAHAAAMGLAAGCAFWVWLREPGWKQTLVAGAVLGLAELTKFTLLVFYPLWPVIWILYRLPGLERMGVRRWLREAGMLMLVTTLSVCVVNLAYACEGSGRRLADFRFQSRLMTGMDSLDVVPEEGATRFRRTWLRSLPVPVPGNYLQGIDTQRWDFERKRHSYLHGRWQMGGWWYYYFYALAVKVPLGTWSLALLAVLVSLFATGYSASWRDELVLLLPPAMIFALVSSQTGIGAHSRYVLPALPFVFVWGSRVARCVTLGHVRVVCLAALALSWSVASSLSIYPHSLSYFNELVGGPAGGHAHLLQSNAGWGQDLLYLRRWLEDHANASPLRMAASFGPVDPRLAGIEFTLPPVAPSRVVRRTHSPREDPGPLPGWYAIDVNHLRGSPESIVNGRGGWQALAHGGHDCTYFQRCQPVATAGYSIYIYHVTLDDANRVRRELGMPELPDC